MFSISQIRKLQFREMQKACLTMLMAAVRSNILIQPTVNVA